MSATCTQPVVDATVSGIGMGARAKAAVYSLGRGVGKICSAVKHFFGSIASGFVKYTGVLTAGTVAALRGISKGHVFSFAIGLAVGAGLAVFKYYRAEAAESDDETDDVSDNERAGAGTSANQVATDETDGATNHATLGGDGDTDRGLPETEHKTED